MLERLLSDMFKKKKDIVQLILSLTAHSVETVEELWTAYWQIETALYFVNFITAAYCSIFCHKCLEFSDARLILNSLRLDMMCSLY